MPPSDLASPPTRAYGVLCPQCKCIFDLARAVAIPPQIPKKAKVKTRRSFCGPGPGIGSGQDRALGAVLREVDSVPEELFMFFGALTYRHLSSYSFNICI